MIQFYHLFVTCRIFWQPGYRSLPDKPIFSSLVLVHNQHSLFAMRIASGLCVVFAPAQRSAALGSWAVALVVVQLLVLHMLPAAAQASGYYAPMPAGVLFTNSRGAGSTSANSLADCVAAVQSDNALAFFWDPTSGMCLRNSGDRVDLGWCILLLRCAALHCTA